MKIITKIKNEFKLFEYKTLATKANKNMKKYDVSSPEYRYWKDRAVLYAMASLSCK